MGLGKASLDGGICVEKIVTPSLAERGPLSPKHSEGIRVAFQEAGGWARPGSHPEQSEFRARSGEGLSRVLSMEGHNRIYFLSFFAS